MTALKCLAAATVLMLSAQIAPACDDFDEEMLLAAAYEATKLAQSQAPQQQATGQPAAAPASATPTGVASIDPLQARLPDAVQR